MNVRNRFNIGSGLLITALMLVWPGGRPSYIALETLFGLDIIWWFWPALSAVVALLLFLLPVGRPLLFSFVTAAVLFLIFGLAVIASVGPGVLVGAAWTSMLGTMRIVLDLKTDIEVRRRFLCH